MAVAWLQRCWLSLAAFLWICPAQAAPSIHWNELVRLSAQDGSNSGVTVDLRSRWQATVVRDVQLSSATALEPDQVWG